jgi:hypothetical protein
LLHGVGNRPRDSEVDVSLIYGDYYFLEALVRYLTLPPPTGAGARPYGEGFRLYPNEPNPFRGETQVIYVLPRETRVSLAVYDVRGRRVRGLANDLRARGSHSARWDGRDERGRKVGPGVYFLRLQTRESTLSRKITVSR